jgi:hypothetical protein
MISGPELLGVAFWDCVIAVGVGVFYRVRRWLRHHHVPHRKLRAVGPLQQGDVPTAARSGGAAGRTTSEQPHPAPRPPTLLGAGPNSGPLTVGLARASCPVADESHPEAQTVATDSRPATPGGLGLKQPVTVGSAVAGSPLPARARLGWGTHPRGEGDDATCTRLVASSRGVA